jgi:hypothetical protein
VALGAAASHNPEPFRMAIDHQLYGSPRSVAESSATTLRRLVRELAVHDWIVLFYLIGLNIAAVTAEPGPARLSSITRVSSLLAFLLMTLILVRGGVLRDRVIAPLLYRLGIYGSVQLSYFFMGELLPIVNLQTLDRELYELDLALFGFEPAVAMDAWINAWTTEWFAFFYFGYFFLLALHVVPILMLSRRARLVSEFSLGMLIIFCVGHTLYMVVPGYGPHKAMADHFQNAFPHGLWLDLVMQTVASGGAQMDIFPSLHTGAPTFIALFSFRHRDKMPFRYTWPVVAFFAVNIIFATMFLRWHYVIDVVAGLALACFAAAASAWVTRREFAHRIAQRLTDSWPAFYKTPRFLTTRLDPPNQHVSSTKEAA